ncbi:MAG: hypothetical protein H0W08_00535 [Acidobacteria bacterium]|nr:hypothetical protein [Acidobacteriota bacterium]
MRNVSLRTMVVAGSLGVSGTVGLVLIAPAGVGFGMAIGSALAWCWWIDTYPHT